MSDLEDFEFEEEPPSDAPFLALEKKIDEEFEDWLEDLIKEGGLNL